MGVILYYFHLIWETLGEHCEKLKKKLKILLFLFIWSQYIFDLEFLLRYISILQYILVVESIG